MNMKVLFGLLIFTTSLLAQSGLLVDVADKSPDWSPLQVTGTVRFTERVTGNTLWSISDYEVTGRNTSAKQIILVIGMLDEASREGAAGSEHIIAIDRVFSPIAPGESFVLDKSYPGNKQWICCLNPFTPGTNPKAEFTTRYVEFAEGAAVGDVTSAKQALDQRANTLRTLAMLDTTRGDDRFVESLLMIQTGGTAGVFDAIRQIQRENGTAAARSAVHAFLRAGTESLSRLSQSK
jgi:hypothetical protein